MLAVVPRQRDLSRILVSFNARIRRLEVNRTNIKTGAAIFTLAPSVSPATSWTPDWSTATKQQDTIGLKPVTAGLMIPANWYWWAHSLVLATTSAPPPMGEFMVWALETDATFDSTIDTFYGDYHYDAMVDSSGSHGAQVFGGCAAGETGDTGDGGVFLPGMSTNFGTEFTPSIAGILVMGLQLYGPQLPHAGTIH